MGFGIGELRYDFNRRLTVEFHGERFSFGVGLIFWGVGGGADWDCCLRGGGDGES